MFEETFNVYGSWKKKKVIQFIQTQFIQNHAVVDSVSFKIVRFSVVDYIILLLILQKN